jgi:hypothetical protein
VGALEARLSRRRMSLALGRWLTHVSELRAMATRGVKVLTYADVC